MRIKNLKVQNFKSLSSLSSSSFNKMNFIHGFNNSGKSNLLKFLELVFMGKTIMSSVSYVEDDGTESIRKVVDANTPFWQGYIYDMPFIFTNNLRDENILFDVQLVVANDEFELKEILTEHGYLYPDKERKEVLVTIKGEIKSTNQTDSEMILKEVKLREHKIFSNNDGVYKYFEEPKESKLSGAQNVFEEIMSMFTNCVSLIESERYFIKERMQREFPETFTTRNFKNWLYGLSLDADKFEKFVSLISFLDEFKITSKVGRALENNLTSYPFTKPKITFSKFNDEIEIMLENRFGRLPLKNFGTGVQQLLYILSRLFVSDAKIILIEELELNLSPQYQELIINNLQSFIHNKKIDQVFFTSHSDYLLRDDFSIYEVSIGADGKSEIKTSNYSDLKSTRRALMDLTEPKK